MRVIWKLKELWEFSYKIILGLDKNKSKAI